ncbi:MAG: hypothetical protein K6A30_04895 [Lachnospiraceae bacterium]|nr:hypothetical protein [Lachnospiraceae bacterium]
MKKNLKTRAIPSVCMLAAGFIRCVFAAVYREELIFFLWTLILVMVIFLIIGHIVKFFLDRNFKEMIEDAPVVFEDEGEEKELENIDENQPNDEGVFVTQKNPDNLGGEETTEQ